MANSRFGLRSQNRLPSPRLRLYGGRGIGFLQRWSFRQVPIVYQGDVVHRFYCLGLMRGTLCVMCDDYIRLKFLTMEVCGDVISWIPFASLAHFDSLVPRHSLYFRPMTFSTNRDTHVFLDWCWDEFIFCDLAKGTAVMRQIQFISLQRVKKRKAVSN